MSVIGHAGVEYQSKVLGARGSVAYLEPRHDAFRNYMQPQVTAIRVDLIYGSNSQLRTIAEEYAANGGEEWMIDRFVKGWVKVMKTTASTCTAEE